MLAYHNDKKDMILAFSTKLLIVILSYLTRFQAYFYPFEENSILILENQCLKYPLEGVFCIPSLHNDIKLYIISIKPEKSHKK